MTDLRRDVQRRVRIVVYAAVDICRQPEQAVTDKVMFFMHFQRSLVREPLRFLAEARNSRAETG